MANLSRTELIGKIGKDRPTLEYTAQGLAISKCNIAVTNRSGKTEWIPIFAEGKTAEIMGDPAGNYTSGKEVHVDGQNETKKIPVKGGAPRFVTFVKAFFVQLTGNAPAMAMAGMDVSADALSGGGNSPEPEVDAPAAKAESDDVPF